MEFFSNFLAHLRYLCSFVYLTEYESSQQHIELAKTYRFQRLVAALVKPAGPCGAYSWLQRRQLWGTHPMDLFHQGHVPLVQSFIRRYPILGVCVLLRAITLGITVPYIRWKISFPGYDLCLFLFRSLNSAWSAIHYLSLTCWGQSWSSLIANITSMFTHFDGIVLASFGGSRPYQSRIMIYHGRCS